MGAWPMVALHILAVIELLPDTKKRLHAPPFEVVGLRGLPFKPTNSKKLLLHFAGLENSLCHSLQYTTSLAAQAKSNDTLHPGHRRILATFTALCASLWIFHSSLEGECHR